MTVLARARDLSRRFHGATALDGVSLDIRAGEVLGLLGPNGAGKSTLINVMTGLLRPGSGSVELCGGDPRSEATRRVIGVTPQETGLPETWRVAELVDFVSAHFPDPVDRTELLDRFDLVSLADRQAGGLSGGQQRRVAVALAFVGRPRLVFLDEPTTGLDVDARRALWEGIRSFHAEGGAVLLTSHYIEEVEALADRVVVMDRGRIIADGGIAEIRGRVRLKRVTLTDPVLPELIGVTSIERDADRAHLLTNDAGALVRELVTAGASFTDIEIESASLEDAFLAITGHRRAT
ncbi:ABC transporter ATP-binding protein [Rhodococcus triatomae]|uniref:ABC-2 type transport system ATP-binding protein n=1 Tax=Rhodococcus triatomae TaxID=300028 RepID=A0A1G8DYS2_9NOCA|nr:ABC transporter ATP-binding protein [Rhodococcus triatomae]QNG18315.1 ABC transporter ATP-binding protein [Rhodococcus triatomae]QNG22015.1 ABC transporter ATP-binding protein [Rhodococcus triatomae]SDH62783.1 ABC-2 type transport system ATP-binding protein [Rhodococcus triatomae]